MRFVNHLTPALIWINFAHLFLASFLPFTTAWIARTQLGLSRADARRMHGATRRRARKRSLLVLIGFTTMLASFAVPRLGSGLICAALFPHLQPDAGPSQVDDNVPRRF